MRRTEDRLATTYKCDRATIRWLAIAWAKQVGHVPPSLNRTDRHGREIPFWVTDIMWDLREGPQQEPWHTRRRWLLSGILEATGAENIPITDRTTVKALYKSMRVGRGGNADWTWADAADTTNWFGEKYLELR